MHLEEVEDGCVKNGIGDPSSIFECDSLIPLCSNTHLKSLFPHLWTNSSDERIYWF